MLSHRINDNFESRRIEPKCHSMTHNRTWMLKFVCLVNKADEKVNTHVSYQYLGGAQGLALRGSRSVIAKRKGRAVALVVALAAALRLFGLRLRLLHNGALLLTLSGGR